MGCEVRFGVLVQSWVALASNGACDEPSGPVTPLSEPQILSKFAYRICNPTTAGV